MRATVYARVSTEDQEREGTSLESQLEACRRKAQELGYEAPEDKLILETYSGLTLDRPKLSVLRHWVRDKEINAIIVYSTDRLSRDPVHLLLLAEECEKAGIALVFVTEPLDNSMEGQLLGFVRGWASKLEAAKIRERSMRGKRTRAEKGRLPSGTGRKLYGYDYLPGKGIGEGIRYVNEQETKWVREMYQWLVEDHLTVNAITRRLRALGVPPPYGKFWIRQTVYRILTNPAYIGRTYAFTRDYVEPERRRNPVSKRKKTGVVWKPRSEWVEIPNATPAIISEELFEAAQKILRRNKQLATRNAKRPYLLSGYIFCTHCGRRYQGYVKKWRDNGKPSEQCYYRCGGSQTIVNPDPCDNRQLHAPNIEKAIWKQIEAFLCEPETVLTGLEKRKEEADRASFLERDLETLKTRLKHKSKEKDRIYRAFYVTGDEERFKKDMAMLLEEIKALEEGKTELENRIEANKRLEVNIEGIKEACELVRKNLGTLSFEDKRLVLEALQIRVKVDDSVIYMEGAIPIPQGAIESSASR